MLDDPVLALQLSASIHTVVSVVHNSTCTPLQIRLRLQPAEPQRLSHCRLLCDWCGKLSRGICQTKGPANLVFMTRWR